MQFLIITARGASLADFIQPSLGPLQPNLDDFMDTLEPLQGQYKIHCLIVDANDKIYY